MKLFALLPLAAGLASAHFTLDFPEWRGDSFADGASQWIYPCANVSETARLDNRTQWSTTGGSIKLGVHHPWALTYVNLGIGTNVSSFNVSLVNNFNQTGNGTFCLKKANLEEGLKEAGITLDSLEGKQGSLQIIQIGATGGALYNCADITFNATAALLSDDECANSTGVAGVGIQNVGTSPASNTTQSSGAVAVLKQSAVGRSVIAGLLGLAFSLL